MSPRVWPISFVGSWRLFGTSVLILAALLFSSQLALAQSVFTQQGPKLVGSGAVGGEIQQGFSVSLSADGNTAIVGGPNDNLNAGAATGAAWVFTRSNGVWTQQGSPVPTKAGMLSTTLIEAYRDENGLPRQRVLANLRGETNTLRALAKLAVMYMRSDRRASGPFEPIDART